MQIDPRAPTTKNPPERFTGDVWLDPIASPRDAGQRMTVAGCGSRRGADRVALPRTRPDAARDPGDRLGAVPWR